jgi:hypothetical protein
MNRKSLIVIAICGVLVSTMIFGAYQLGYSNSTKINYQKGFNDGLKFGSGQASGNLYQNGYQSGYQAGLNLNKIMNGTVP